MMHVDTRHCSFHLDQDVNFHVTFGFMSLLVSLTFPGPTTQYGLYTLGDTSLFFPLRQYDLCHFGFHSGFPGSLDQLWCWHSRTHFIVLPSHINVVSFTLGVAHVPGSLDQ